MNLDPAMVEAANRALLRHLGVIAETDGRVALEAALSSLPDGVYVGNDGTKKRIHRIGRVGNENTVLQEWQEYGHASMIPPDVEDQDYPGSVYALVEEGSE